MGDQRIEREKKTVVAMTRIYCRAHHHPENTTCTECEEFIDYALKRLDKCPFGEKKPTCQNCTIHCYKETMKEKAKTVMRFAGPRMMTRHPYLAIMHLVDKWMDKSHLDEKDKDEKEDVA